MHAVIKTGGQQFKVAKGDVMNIAKSTLDVGQSFDFNEVLLLSDGVDNITIGKPLVAGAKVSAVVLAHGRAPKIIVQKFRRRKHYDKRTGHRQDFTKIEILDIIA